MSLSWERNPQSIAVAITTAKNKEHHNKILYLTNDIFERKDKTKKPIVRDVTRDEISTLIPSRYKLRRKLIDDMYIAINSDAPFEHEDSHIIEIYEKLKDVRSKNNSIIDLPHGSEFELLPLMRQDFKDGFSRQTLFISGMQRSGKSFFVKKYIMLYNEIFPKNKIYFISQQKKDNDESLGEVKYLLDQIPLEDLMDKREPITWESFIDKPCLVIFDDYDGLEKKPEKKGEKAPYHAVLSLLSNILKNGGKFGTSCLVTTHETNARDGSMSEIIKQVEYFVLFCKGMTKYNLEYFGTRYLGLGKRLLEEMRTSASRWYAVRRFTPMFVLSQYDARILE